MDGDVDLFAADFVNEGGFDVSAVVEPGAVLALGHLIPFWRVKACEANVSPGDPYTVRVGDVCFVGNCQWGEDQARRIFLG